MIAVTRVRSAVQTMLEAKLPAELEASAVRELPEEYRDYLMPPRLWKRLQTYRALKPDQSPAVAVSSPGLAEAPKRMGDGEWSAVWAVHVFCATRGPGFDLTADITGAYLAAIRTTLLKFTIELDGAQRAKWVAETYDLIDSDSQRTIGAGLVAVNLPVRGVTLEEADPEIPYGEQVTSTIVDVEPMED